MSFNVRDLIVNSLGVGLDEGCPPPTWVTTNCAPTGVSLKDRLDPTMSLSSLKQQLRRALKR